MPSNRRHAEVIVTDGPPDIDEHPIGAVADPEPAEPPVSLYDAGRLSLRLAHHVGEDWSEPSVQAR